LRIPNKYKKLMNRRNPTWGGIVVGESSPVTTKPLPRRNTAHKNAKFLRRNQTPAEIKLNEILKDLNGGVLKGRFFCQWAFADKWILDFFFYENRLGIEVDGSIHKETEQCVRDNEKEKACKEWGITLIRIRNHEVFGGRDYLVNLLRKGWRQANQNIKDSPFALKIKF
jgi:very-short-patch-repair endonuclease